MKLTLESRLPGEISVTSDMKITTLMAENKELKRLLMVKEDSEKAGLKLNIQKTKIMASSTIMANKWGNNGNSDRLFSWTPKS